MTRYNFDMIYIGNYTDMDTNESDLSYDKVRQILEGTTHTATTGAEIITATFNDADNSGSMWTDSYARNGFGDSGDRLEYSINGTSQTQIIDIITGVNTAVLTSPTGETLNIRLALIQAQNGDVFLKPGGYLDSSGNYVHDIPTGFVIDEIQLTGPITSTYSDSVSGAGFHPANDVGRFTMTEATAEAGPVNGTSGNDTMNIGYTDGDGDQIDGADGNDDTIYGYGGNDRIGAGNGSDIVYGGAGNDTINGGAGSDTIFGGNGNDYIYQTANSTTPYDNQADSINAGAGDDTIRSSFGNDTIDGGTGTDLYDSSRFGQHTNIDLNTNSGSYAGTATTDFTIRNVENLSTGSGNDTIVGSTADNLIHTNTGDDTIHAGAGNDTVNAGDGNDTAYGGSGDDSVSGGGGDDLLYGNDGNDTLSGSAGNDYMRGGAGNDTLTGGSDNDSLAGGADDDSIDGGTGKDTCMSSAHMRLMQPPLE